MCSRADGGCFSPAQRRPGTAHLQVHLFCAVYFILYMIAFTAITIWWVAACMRSRR